jgi:hypothetical protein
MNRTVEMVKQQCPLVDNKVRVDGAGERGKLMNAKELDKEVSEFNKMD